MNIPAFTGPHGMPVGLSVIGLPHQDVRLLQIADVVGTCLDAAVAGECSRQMCEAVCTQSSISRGQHDYGGRASIHHIEGGK